jgi:hypothetical protein
MILNIIGQEPKGTRFSDALGRVWEYRKGWDGLEYLIGLTAATPTLKINDCLSLQIEGFKVDRS